MSEKKTVAAIAGWYTDNTDNPHLIGSRCKDCGTYYFPKQNRFCKSPDCESTEFEEVELSNTGKIWSYTDAQYQPPEPYIAEEPYIPYAIAAVELEKEKMIILGQVAKGVTVSDLTVGQSVKLVLETLHEDEKENKIIWKWQPTNN